MASCQSETKKYRQCLKDAHSSGCSGSKKCKSIAIELESCREKWRTENSVKHEFDGRRILPNKKCKLLNAEVQKCMKWKKSDESQCQEPIKALRVCMEREEGIIAAPTEGDKIWSDYKHNRK